MGEIGYQRNEGPPEPPSWQEQLEEWLDDCPFTLTEQQRDTLREWELEDRMDNEAEAKTR